MSLKKIFSVLMVIFFVSSTLYQPSVYGAKKKDQIIRNNEPPSLSVEVLFLIPFLIIIIPLVATKLTSDFLMAYRSPIGTYEHQKTKKSLTQKEICPVKAKNIQWQQVYLKKGFDKNQQCRRGKRN